MFYIVVYKSLVRLIPNPFHCNVFTTNPRHFRLPVLFDFYLIINVMYYVGWFIEYTGKDMHTGFINRTARLHTHKGYAIFWVWQWVDCISVSFRNCTFFMSLSFFPLHNISHERGIYTVCCLHGIVTVVWQEFNYVWFQKDVLKVPYAIPSNGIFSKTFCPNRAGKLFLLFKCSSSSPPSATYMRQWIGSALVQIMHTHIFILYVITLHTLIT